jgi:molybdopterin molybdotransferase
LSLLSGETIVPFAGYPVRAAFAYKRKAGRREMMRVRLQPAADGMLEAVRHTNDGSAVLTSLCATDGILEIAETKGEVMPGEMLAFRPYSLVW